MFKNSGEKDARGRRKGVRVGERKSERGSERPRGKEAWWDKGAILRRERLYNRTQLTLDPTCWKFSATRAIENFLEEKNILKIWQAQFLGDCWVQK